MNRIRGLRSQLCVSLKGPKQKRIGSEREICLSSLEILKISTIVVFRCRGCLIAESLCTKSIAPVSVWTGKRFIPNVEGCFSKPTERKCLEETIFLFGALLLRIERMLERLVRELKTPEALQFVPVSFPNVLALCNNSRN